MSYNDVMSSGSSSEIKMDKSEVTKLVRRMVAADSACLRFRKHCIERMVERGLNQRDVINVLLGGKCTVIEPHPRSGLWVYRFETNNYRVECNVFRNDSIVVITVIRKRRGG